MKTAEQWQQQLNGETSLQSIREIQADALIHASKVVRQELFRLGFKFSAVPASVAILEEVRILAKG